mgnify:CR=1 FL=1
MSDLREPKAGDYQVRKVKVYLTKEAIKKDGREEPDILESLYKGSDFYFCGEHFEISKYFDNATFLFQYDVLIHPSLPLKISRQLLEIHQEKIFVLLHYPQL